MRKANLINKRFGCLTAIKRVSYKDKSGCTFWKCLCDCGNIKNIRTKHLISGETKSCGCRINDNKAGRGAQFHKLEYNSWNGMLQRCLHPNHKDYYMYGAKGITVSKSWQKSFKTFFADMGPRPFKNASLDRIDGKKGYSKENCRWASKKLQSLNSSISTPITYKGITWSCREWARFLGIHKNTFMYKYHKGISMKNIIKYAERKSKI